MCTTHSYNKERNEPDLTDSVLIVRSMIKVYRTSNCPVINTLSKVRMGVGQLVVDSWRESSPWQTVLRVRNNRCTGFACTIQATAAIGSRGVYMGFRWRQLCKLIHIVCFCVIVVSQRIRWISCLSMFRAGTFSYVPQFLKVLTDQFLRSVAQTSRTRKQALHSNRVLYVLGRKQLKGELLCQTCL